MPAKNTPEPEAHDAPITTPDSPAPTPAGKPFARLPVPPPGASPHKRRGRESPPNRRTQAVDPRRRRSPSSRFRG